MRIRSSITNSPKILCDLTIAEHQKFSAGISSERHMDSGISGVKMNFLISATAGFCLMHQQLQVQKETQYEFSIDGPHVLLNFTDGMIQRIYSPAAQHNVCIKAEHSIQQFSIILSAAYLRQLLKNEHWIHSDQFMRDLQADKSTDAHNARYFVDHQIANIVQNIQQDFSDQQYHRNFLELKIKELLMVLQGKEQTYGNIEGINSEDYDKLVRAKGLLMMQYTDPPTIKQLSRLVALNEFKLKKQFKIAFGTTIRAFVIQLRMEEAKRLLNSHYSVSDLSAKTGYRNVSHFIDTFKRFYGETPKQAIKTL
jgi:AraC family transcriptional activator of pyochelin receptor